MTITTNHRRGKRKQPSKRSVLRRRSRTPQRTRQFHVTSGAERDSEPSSSSTSLAASLIVPSLYLGPCTAASSRDFISSNAVTHILSIGCSPSKRFEGVTYKHVTLDDSPSSSITKACDIACEFIDDALGSQQGKGRILVHCKLGISRSPTIVAAYLMRRRGMSLRDALRRILQARPQIQPNPGFLVQLKEMELELRGEVSLDIVELSKLQKDHLLSLSNPDSEQNSSLAPSHTKLSSGRISRPPQRYGSRP